MNDFLYTSVDKAMLINFKKPWSNRVFVKSIKLEELSVEIHHICS